MEASFDSSLYGGIKLRSESLDVFKNNESQEEIGLYLGEEFESTTSL